MGKKKVPTLPAEVRKEAVRLHALANNYDRWARNARRSLEALQTQCKHADMTAQRGTIPFSLQAGTQYKITSHCPTCLLTKYVWENYIKCTCGRKHRWRKEGAHMCTCGATYMLTRI